MKVKAVIAYDGSTYQGFQKQTSTKNTVTTAIEEALRDLQINSAITGSGRTDAGVHASGQVIHFDLPAFWSDLSRLRTALNRKFSSIQFKHVCEVSDDFHARFSARERIYRYVFKESEPSVFEKNYIAHYDTFDAVLLSQALSLFRGRHDFAYFHKTGSQIHTTVREIYRTYYRKQGKYHFIYFSANGFLRSQVRMMVEASMQCAQGLLTIETLQEQIECKGQALKKLAPAQGLYLARILY